MNNAIVTNPRRSTPMEILNILKFRGGATVDEIGTALGVTTTAVRQHLTLLEKDGLISSSLLRKGMGRPSRLYGLTDRGDELFPKKYHALATDLLDAIRALDGDAKLELVLRHRAEQVAAAYAHRMSGKDLKGRVEVLVDMLNENGSLAEYEAIDGILHVMEHNCLLFKVASRFPQICASEHWLLTKVLDARITRLHCFAKGDPICEFTVKEHTASVAQP